MAVFQFLFDIQTDVFVHGTVVACDQITEEGAQFLNDGFRHLTSIGKDEGRGVGADQIRNGFDVVFEQFGHREIAELRMRDEDVKVKLPRARNLGDGHRCWLAPGLSIVAAHEVLCNGFKRFHRRGNTDALHGIFEQ